MDVGRNTADGAKGIGVGGDIMVFPMRIFVKIQAVYGGTDLCERRYMAGGRAIDTDRSGQNIGDIRQPATIRQQTAVTASKALTSRRPPGTITVERARLSA